MKTEEVQQKEAKVATVVADRHREAWRLAVFKRKRVYLQTGSNKAAEHAACEEIARAFPVQIEGLLQMVQRLQWSAEIVPGIPCCPVCGSAKSSEGHESNCQLAHLASLKFREPYTPQMAGKDISHE